MPGAKLGQHWLTDKRVSKQIAEAVGLTQNDTCIEIGGGRGALTRYLIPLAGRLIVYEIDPKWASHLREFSPSWGGEPEIRELDALKIVWDRQSLGIAPDEVFYVTGNLPYYITSPLLLRLAYSRLDFKHAVFLIQKEVAERIAAKPKDSAYSRLTVSLGAFLESEILFDVPRDAFSPVPKVTSTLIRLTPREKPEVGVEMADAFERLVKAAFHMRRKTLKNNLVAGFYDITPKEVEDMLDCMGINQKARAQELPISDFATLARLLTEKGK
jgi:16S rRNA (adenine1518-N6/adenine1519-N6)-dimethyltransferase